MSGLLMNTLFAHPLDLNRWQQTLLLLPLCLAISLVYKTTRCSSLRELPVAVLVHFVTIVVGMYVVGVGLFLVFELAT